MNKKKKFKMSKKGKLAITIFIILILLIIYIVNTITYRMSDTYKMLELGYTEEEIETIFNKTNDSELDAIMLLEYNKEIPEVLIQKYFIFDKLENYLQYSEDNPSLSLKEVITMVNVNRDQEYYSDIEEVDTSKDELMLVNKYNSLSENYTPEDIVSVSKTHGYGDNTISKSTYDAFKAMYNAAKEEDLTLIINSGYRSYDNQQAVHDNISNISGSDYADTVAARAGHSEHQSGLGLDIITYNATNQNFHESDEYKWLIDNAHKYGFILRYPEDKEHITGYSYESWHFRYVGEEVASEIDDLDITFDEYYAFYIENK